jgi:hypothetical protein
MTLWLEWLRTWRARRNGTIDGQNMIPDQGDANPTQYALFLRDRGQELIDKLDLWFRQLDRRMHPAYRECAILYSQARELHQQALAAAGLARQAYEERPTERRKLDLRRATLHAARLQHQAHEAEQRLEAAIAYRLAKYDVLRARCLLIQRQTEKLLKQYTLANIRARATGDTPPGLAESAQPQIRLPYALGGLEWSPPLDAARAGAARGADAGAARGAVTAAGHASALAAAPAAAAGHAGAPASAPAAVPGQPGGAQPAAAPLSHSEGDQP